MGWSERQRAMLQEIGIRLWLPQSDPAGDRGGAPAAAAPGAPADGSPAPAPAPAANAAPAAYVEPARPRAEVVRGPRAVGVETMDWAQLRQAVVDCTACKLCSGRRQTVFGVGHERARWMIVGEAPGEQEDRQGEPFVGKSGQLLDNMLRAIGLTRAEADASRQVYIANTLKCRPPGNRNPEPEELAQCEPFLIRQIALVQPKIIVAMGRYAVQSLLRSDEPIGRLRGRVHRYQGVPLIVTYHPAYLLRNLDDKARAWDDLCLAVATAGAAAG
jgi:uracil-DNA glycosylase family 4